MTERINSNFNGYNVISTLGSLRASDVTVGNLTVTGFTTTVNVTEQNVVDTNITTGSLNATGITAGNINFTGSLYQNGAAYSSGGASPAVDNYYMTTGSTSAGFNLIAFSSPSNAFNTSGSVSYGTSGITCSAGTFTNTSGVTRVVHLNIYDETNGAASTIYIKQNSGLFTKNFIGSGNWNWLSWTLILNNNDTFSIGISNGSSHNTALQIVVIK